MVNGIINYPGNLLHSQLVQWAVWLWAGRPELWSYWGQGSLSLSRLANQLWVLQAYYTRSNSISFSRDEVVRAWNITVQNVCSFTFHSLIHLLDVVLWQRNKMTSVIIHNASLKVLNMPMPKDIEHWSGSESAPCPRRTEISSAQLWQSSNLTYNFMQLKNTIYCNVEINHSRNKSPDIQWAT